MRSRRPPADGQGRLVGGEYEQWSVHPGGYRLLMLELLAVDAEVALGKVDRIEGTWFSSGEETASTRSAATRAPP